VRRKFAAFLMILSGINNIRIIILTIWVLTFEFSKWPSSNFSSIEFKIIWGPMIGSIICVVFLIIGSINAFKKKKWWLVLSGSLFSLPMPVIWQLIIFNNIEGAISGFTLLIGIVSVILVLISRNEFKQSPNMAREINR
jgi:hypothetical protein